MSDICDIKADLKRASEEGEILARAALQLICDLQAERDAAVMAEREACAEFADDHTPEKHGGALASHVTGKAIASAIRARSNKEPGQ